VSRSQAERVDLIMVEPLPRTSELKRTGVNPHNALRPYPWVGGGDNSEVLARWRREVVSVAK
jgi:hypothetical protein